MSNKAGIKLSSIMMVTFLMLGLFPCFTYAVQISDAYVIYDPDTQIVKIGGSHQGGAGRQVTVSVVLNNEVEPFYWSGKVTDANGAFEFIYYMDQGKDTSGWYNVLIGGAGLSPISKKYVFLTASEDLIITDMVNEAADASTMENLINTKGNLFGLDNTEGSKFAGLSIGGMTKVYEALCKRNFANTAEVKKAFDQAVAIQKLNEADPSKAAITISEFAGELGFDISETSYYFLLRTDAGRSSVYSAVIGKNFSLRDVQAVCNVFEKAAALSAVNDLGTVNRDKIIAYINDFNTKGYTDISLNEYNSSDFDDVDRLNIIIEAIDKKPFSSFLDFKQKFIESINKIKTDNQNKKTDLSTTDRPRSVNNSISVNKSSYIETPIPEDKKYNSFTDIDSVPWAKESIKYLVDKNILVGTSVDTFEPDRAITREEFIKMLTKAFKIEDATATTNFTDVNEGSWYYQYVSAAYGKGIVKGIDSDNFGVGRPITREQVCTIIYRAVEMLSIKMENMRNGAEFTDKDKIASYAQSAVDSLYNAGIIDGMDDNTFKPDEKTTRAMAAKIIYNALERSSLK